LLWDLRARYCIRATAAKPGRRRSAWTEAKRPKIRGHLHGVAFNRKPDLAVSQVNSQVSLNENCQVVISIRNFGPGNIPDTAWSDGPVELEIMSEKIEILESVDFAVLDPERNLKYPGGGAKYTTDIELEDEQKVRILVDSKNRVKEMYHGNNSVEKELKCEDKVGVISTPMVFPGIRTDG